MAKILQKVALPKPIKTAIKFIMGQPLEQAVFYLNTSLQAIRNGDYPRAGAFALAASLVAGRHYAKRPEESTKVAAFADSFISYAVAHENAPQSAAAVTVGFGAGAKNLISKKIRTLMHEGYPAKQAQAIAYSMARKSAHAAPKRAPRTMGSLARTMALVKMLESV